MKPHRHWQNVQFFTDILARAVTFCNSAIIYLDFFVSKEKANSWLGPITTIEQKAINRPICDDSVFHYDNNKETNDQLILQSNDMEKITFWDKTQQATS